MAAAATATSLDPEQAERAFLEGLFADLDEAVFDVGPSSDPPAISRPSPPRETLAAGPVRKPLRTPPARSKPSAKSSSSPFWADPGKKPLVRSVDLSRPAAQAHRLPAGKQRAVKRVEVQLEDDGGAQSLSRYEDLKENRRAHARDLATSVKSSPKRSPKVLQTGQSPPIAGVDIDFDALMDGVDWGDFDESTMGQETPSLPRTPHSRQYTRCTVLEVENAVSPAGQPQKTLTVTLAKNDVFGLCEVWLQDDWIETPVEQGDTINLIGSFDATVTPSLVLTRRDSSLIILHPDILVSSTKVADSAHCTRKALLQELIRTSAGSGSASPALIYGNMLHELMQASMVEGRWDDEWRKERIQEVVHDQVAQLWTCDLSVDKAVEDMLDKSKELEGFSATFIGAKPQPDAVLSDLRATSTDLARLAITSTLSVEEDIWSPRFGLKGKIDVSVTGTVAEAGGRGLARSGTLPFEIKSGKTNAGMEHRAQTMLYTLLMSDRYDEEIDSGLLFYTQSNAVIRVKAAKNELRGLLIARNNFATYLHRRMTLSTHVAPSSSAYSMPNQTQAAAAPADVIDEDEEALWAGIDLDVAALDDVVGADQIERSLLPAPIDEMRSCKRCYVADACMLFRKANETDQLGIDIEDEELGELYEDKTAHLSSTHLEFFKKWEKLISYEEQELVRYKKEIWTMTAEQRTKMGRCLDNMTIDPTFEQPQADGSGAKIHRYTYRLQHALPLATQASPTQKAERSLLNGGMTVNDPVVVSLENPYVLSMSRGFVLEVTARHIVLGLDHSLTTSAQAARALPPSTQAADLVFRIDKDELAAGMGRIRDNIIQLFVNGGDEKRRRLVVDLDAPTFYDSVPADQDHNLVPSHLNADQERAVKKVLTAQDYALILGMPGTGKTTTIAEILKALCKAGKSVLLTSYTHSAVDNILLKVKDAGLSILRLGNRDKIMPVLHEFTMDPTNKPITLSQLDNLFMTPQIVATTCLGINEPIFAKRHFDVCIVDEASQVTLPTCLGPLRFADTFVLVGDHNQLPPLVRNQAARKGGLDVSLFKRLSEAHPQALVYLSEQYRMNDDIMLLSNKLVYQDRLRAGSAAVAGQRLVLPKPDELDTLDLELSTRWLRHLLDPERTVVFVDTDLLPARERRVGSLIENEIEARLVCQTTEALVRCGVPPESVGIIALYRQQLKLISRKLEYLPAVEILTADRSQGRDKGCIIMSLTRSNTEGHVGDLLKDWRRINVCLTRAKSKLLVFGSRSTLSHLPLLQRFFDVVCGKNWIYQLPAEAATVTGEATGERPKRERTEEAESRSKLKARRSGEGALAVDILNCL